MDGQMKVMLPSNSWIVSLGSRTLSVEVTAGGGVITVVVGVSIHD